MRRSAFNYTLQRCVSTNVKTIQNVAGSSSGDTYNLGALSFKLEDFIDTDNFAVIYDRYCIKRIRVKFWWANNSYGVSSGASTTQSLTRPTMFISKDYDDENKPVSDATVRDMANCKHYTCDQWSLSFKPSVLMIGTISGSGTFNVPKWNQWIDLAYTAVPHYGLKYAIQQPVNMTWRGLYYTVTATVAFAGRR